MRQKLHRYRQFFVILAIMTLVWFVVDMSSMRTYQTTVRIGYVGVDTARYVMTSGDEELPLTVESDGFAALLHHLSWRHRAMDVDLSALEKSANDGRMAVASENYKEELQYRFSPLGRCEIKMQKDSLVFTFSERMQKAYRPLMTDISFTFADGYGLCGMPTLKPDTVFLYGSEESLASIGSLRTQPAEIAVGKEGGQYSLKLVPVWNDYPDVRVSQSEVLLTVPVEPYIEESRTLKVVCEGNSAHERIKLYPDEVTVTFWVPQSRYGADDADDCKAVVRLDDNSGAQELPVTITDFPSELRIKSVEPESVQHVIIR